MVSSWSSKEAYYRAEYVSSSRRSHSPVFFAWTYDDCVNRRRNVWSQFLENSVTESGAGKIRPIATQPLSGQYSAQTGYLKIFLGYASGVGKSFRMLDEARRRHERGQDVVVGAVQPHLSPATDALLRKLEIIPLLRVGEGTVIDVETLIRRHPEACFIDGLAYDNPSGSRNKTRWQDVNELVLAGIKVITSINIQYIDELREQVETITPKPVTQTVPIAFIKRADEIEIVDAPPIELPAEPGEERAGAEQRQQQLSRLREMTLVLAADVVDRQLSNYLESHGIKQQFGTLERILVCITPHSNAQEMIETGQIVARRFYGELIVAYVDQPEISSLERAALNEKLALARTAGARVEILQGRDPIETILDFARTQGITQLFVGHRSGSRIFSSHLHELIRHSRGMDVRIFPNEL